MENLARLGIDLTSLLVYAVNFGLIVLIIAKFFSGPLLKMLEDRRQSIKSNIEEAEKLKMELATQMEKFEKDKKQMEIRMDQEIKTMRNDMERKKKEFDAENEAKKIKMMAEVKTAIDEQKNNLQKELKADLLSMVQRMVMYIVSNKIPSELVQSSVAEAWQNYKK